jgi:hypothetical protein
MVDMKATQKALDAAREERNNALKAAGDDFDAIAKIALASNANIATLERELRLASKELADKFLSEKMETIQSALGLLWTDFVTAFPQFETEYYLSASASESGAINSYGVKSTGRNSTGGSRAIMVTGGMVAGNNPTPFSSLNAWNKAEREARGEVNPSGSNASGIYNFAEKIGATIETAKA